MFNNIPDRIVVQYQVVKGERNYLRDFGFRRLGVRVRKIMKGAGGEENGRLRRLWFTVPDAGSRRLHSKP